MWAGVCQMYTKHVQHIRGRQLCNLLWFVLSLYRDAFPSHRTATFPEKKDANKDKSAIDRNVVQHKDVFILSNGETPTFDLGNATHGCASPRLRSPRTYGAITTQTGGEGSLAPDQLLLVPEQQPHEAGPWHRRTSCFCGESLLCHFFCNLRWMWSSVRCGFTVKAWGPWRRTCSCFTWPSPASCSVSTQLLF